MKDGETLAGGRLNSKVGFNSEKTPTSESNLQKNPEKKEKKGEEEEEDEDVQPVCDGTENSRFYKKLLQNI